MTESRRMDQSMLDSYQLQQNPRINVVFNHENIQYSGADQLRIHYVVDGVDELSLDKRPRLLMLKYGGTADAAAELGGISSIHQTFTGFQPTLYAGT